VRFDKIEEPPLTTGTISTSPPTTNGLPRNKKRTMFFICSQEAGMLRVFVEEAAALASIGLFVGMIAMWAQLIPQL
jgi:hypothetical protein